MNFIIEHEWLLFIVFTVSIFIVSYRFLPAVLKFASEKTSESQREVLDIMEKMRIQRDRKKTITYIWALSLSLSFLVFILLLPNVLPGAGLSFLVFLLSWVGVKAVMKGVWSRYCQIAVSQMVEGMVLMSNGIKVGLSVTQAMERVCDGMKGPLGSEFTLVLNKIKLGMSLEEALSEMAERVPAPDIIMFVTAVNILKETGGNLAEVFATTAETIRSRQKVQSKIKALTAQGMMQARIISAVPVVILGILYFVNPAYAIVLFTTVLGWVCLALIAFLVFIGGRMMKKAATIDV